MRCGTRCVTAASWTWLSKNMRRPQVVSDVYQCILPFFGGPLPVWGLQELAWLVRHTAAPLLSVYIGVGGKQTTQWNWWETMRKTLFVSMFLISAGWARTGATAGGGSSTRSRTGASVGAGAGAGVGAQGGPCLPGEKTWKCGGREGGQTQLLALAGKTTGVPLFQL